jgi:pilus assembly protein Flp/PilA
MGKPHMKLIKFTTKYFAKHDHGAALVEYAILAGLVSVVAIGAVLSTGEQVRDIFSSTTVALASTASQDPVPDMNFTFAAAQAPDPDVVGFSDLNTNDYGNVTGDFHNDHGRLMELIFDVGDNETRVYFDHQVGTLYDGKVIDCGADGSLAFNDPASYPHHSGAAGQGWAWTGGNILNLADGDSLTCTLS